MLSVHIACRYSSLDWPDRYFAHLGIVRCADAEVIGNTGAAYSADVLRFWLAWVRAAHIWGMANLQQPRLTSHFEHKRLRKVA